MRTGDEGEGVQGPSKNQVAGLSNSSLGEVNAKGVHIAEFSSLNLNSHSPVLMFKACLVDERKVWEWKEERGKQSGGSSSRIWILQNTKKISRYDN